MKSEPSKNVLAAMLTGLLFAGSGYSCLFAAEPAGAEGVGLLEEADVRDLVPAWDVNRSSPDLEAILSFDGGEPGANMTVFLGSWCSESQREISRFLRLIDSFKGSVPFSTTYVGVNQEKTEPRQLLADKQVRHLPTFVVTRQGREVGRIVERPPRGLERDLALLLSGQSRGLVSASEDVIRQYLSLEPSRTGARDDPEPGPDS